MTLPKLDTGGINFRRGTMAGALVQGERTKNLLRQEELENMPVQRQREVRSFEMDEEQHEMAKQLHDKEFERLVHTMDDEQKQRLEKELMNSATLLASVTDEKTWNKAIDWMEQNGRGETLKRFGITRDGFDLRLVEYLKKYVAGQQGILKKIEAQNKASLETQKAKSASALQSQKDKATMERVKAITESDQKIASTKKAPKKRNYDVADDRAIQDIVKSMYEDEFTGTPYNLDTKDVPQGQMGQYIHEAKKKQAEIVAKATRIYKDSLGTAKELTHAEAVVRAAEASSGRKRYIYRDGELTLKTE